MLAAAALPAGCAHRLQATAADPSPPGSLAVRPPAPGQRWRYRISDGLTGKSLSVVDETVSAVDADIVIDRRTEGSAPPPAGEEHSGRAIIENFGSHPLPSQTLPHEVQRPWGMIELDPHWDLPQVYAQPIPAWPTELRPGWSRFINTKYVASADSGALSWQQTMRAERWERITVPAGTFTALRYSNQIVFTHRDWARVHCSRQETLWIAPEVGRWIKRMSSGSYYVNDTIDTSAYSEDARNWELLEWS